MRRDATRRDASCEAGVPARRAQADNLGVREREQKGRWAAIVSGFLDEPMSIPIENVASVETKTDQTSPIHWLRVLSIFEHLHGRITRLKPTARRLPQSPIPRGPIPQLPGQFRSKQSLAPGNQDRWPVPHSPLHLLVPRHATSCGCRRDLCWPDGNTRERARLFDPDRWIVSASRTIPMATDAQRQRIAKLHAQADARLGEAGSGFRT